MDISDLVIEVTRRCNMECAHCLRGEAQCKTQKEEHLRNFLRQVSYISNVTFSGGEPTLPSGLKVIDLFIDLCYEYNVGVGNWFIVTNGMKWRSELPNIIWRLQNLCDDNEISGIDVSGDQFHETDEFERNSFIYTLENALEHEGLYDVIKIGKRGNIDYKFVIPEGKGKHYGGKERDVESLIYDWYDNDLSIREGTLYLNCNGNLILGCDWSYYSQDTREDILICNVAEDIEKAIKEKGEIEEEWENVA